MNITFDKNENKFLLEYEDGNRLYASYDGVVNLLARMAGVSTKSLAYRCPTSDELNEFWESEPWVITEVTK